MLRESNEAVDVEKCTIASLEDSAKSHRYINPTYYHHHEPQLNCPNKAIAARISIWCWTATMLKQIIAPWIK